jgi:hypothetical protein
MLDISRMSVSARCGEVHLGYVVIVSDHVEGVVFLSSPTIKSALSSSSYSCLGDEGSSM